MTKNTAGQKIGCQMVSATDGSAFTGATTIAVTGDAGTQATGSVGAGACTHEGLGYHTYAPAQAETNYDLIGFTFTGSGAIPATVQVYTVAGDAFTRLGAPAGASVSADVAAIKAQTAAIETDTQDLQARTPAALVGGRTDANVGAISTDATAADNAEAFFDGTGYAGTANVIPLVTTVTNLTNAATVGDLTSTMKSSVTTAASSSTPALSAAGIDAILDDTIGDGTLTVRQALRVFVAALAGKLSGAATTTVTIRNAADSANVIVATVDAAGNRSAVTVTP